MIYVSGDRLCLSAIYIDFHAIRLPAFIHICFKDFLAMNCMKGTNQWSPPYVLLARAPAARHSSGEDLRSLQRAVV